MRIFKDLFKKSKPEDDSIEIDNTLSIDGHIFKAMTPLSMPKSRQMALHLKMYENDLNMTKEDLLKFVGGILSLLQAPELGSQANLLKDSVSYLHNANKKLLDNLDEARHLVKTLAAVVEADFGINPYLKAACHVILLDNEDPEEISPKIYEYKLNLCKENKKVRDFFLSTSIGLMQSIGALPSNYEAQASYLKALLKSETLLYEKIKNF